jgi:hypothetical protein
LIDWYSAILRMLSVLICLTCMCVADVGHDPARHPQQDHPARPEAVQDDAHLLRHLLQPGEVSGPRAEGSIRHPAGDG